MDTASHLLFGLTLAGLAHMDPVVSQHPELAQAIIAGTVIGSHAPDFDTVSRLKGYSFYIRHHRGVTHSLPGLFLWPALLATLFGYGFGVLDFWMTLYVWIFAAVFFHVFLDLLNTYGVQCLFPFSKKWMHLDILNLFEPFLFFLHASGAVCWLFLDVDPVRIFPLVYLLSLIYILMRAYQHGVLLKKLKETIGRGGIYHLFPNLHWFHWRFVVETDECFYTGVMTYGKVIIQQYYLKEDKNPIIERTEETDGVRAFLKFAQRVHVTCQKVEDGYEVKWSDVRFWYNSKLTFGVDIKLDHNLNVTHHELGWRKGMLEPPFV
ncbi:metal-dependent hydrolase [Ammoniphilus sp. YIM 78166]|uniref:metal-dependent hydrolase n=1 Tax=Ammoniphilus sp. YIM 78166 TaxID=1644106 RepID=UPI00106F1A73|nr:metal-dependent hydrolase [Ammoniphilus sp. YIM 78166]